MKRVLVVVWLVVLLVGVPAAAFAAENTWDSAKTAANGNVYVRGVARCTLLDYARTWFEGYVSSSALTLAGNSTKVYYIHAGGTLWIHAAKREVASYGMGDYDYNASAVSASRRGTSIEPLVVARVYGSHDFKLTSRSTSYSCKTQTPDAG